MKTSISKPSSDKFANYIGFTSACVLAGVSAFVIVYNNPFKIQITPPPTPLKISLKTFSKPVEPIEKIAQTPPPPTPVPPKPIKPKPEHKKPPKPIKRELKPAILPPKPLPKIEQKIETKTEQTAHNPAPTPAPSAPAKQTSQRHLNMATSANDERFLRIVAAIKKHQHYPKQALKMRKMGVVEVGFILQKDGGVRDIKLIKSSGVNSLDEAALKSVQKASREFVALDDEYKISLPISFKIR